MRTLTEILLRIPELGGREALRWRTGYRTGSISYADLARRIAGCAGAFDARGIDQGARVLLWGENGLEWVVAFWACVARGLVVVPVDARASPGFVTQLAAQAGPSLLIHGGPPPPGLDVPLLAFTELARIESGGALGGATAGPDDIVEIVFTSGTTGDPRGVVHRHRNLGANLTPIAAEIARRRLWLRLSGPVRILDLLPLSHLFGQALGLTIPVLLEGTAVFSSQLGAVEVLETIRRERVHAVVVVPQLLENLGHELVRRYGEPDEAGVAGPVVPWIRRAWRYRRLHYDLGPRFWFVVVGGAAVRAEVESFWRQRGFAVVQGYGLTETSPVVAFNHPFATRAGALGKVLPGLEVRIAPDGEILVRGPSVVSEVWTRQGLEPVAAADGWLHTGDLGAIDASGVLSFRGRKKDVIVLPDGTNVHPQDVEAVLERQPGVRASVVVGLRRGGAERVHAVLILNDPLAAPEAIVQSANAGLEAHQRIHGWSLWPQADFPRTLSTAKVKRHEVARQVAATAVAPPAAAGGATPVRDLLARIAQRDPATITAASHLENDLGLSSLERLEVLAALEHELGIGIDEAAFAPLQRVGELEEWIATRVAPAAPAAARGDAGDTAAPAALAAARARAEPPPLPRWRRARPVRLLRSVAREAVILPLLRSYLRFTVVGRDNLRGLRPPLLFAANHTSHLDTPAVMAALPAAWRRRLAPAMMQEFFRAHFEPERAGLLRRLRSGLAYHLACGLLNAFPLPQQLGGVRRALQFVGEEIDAGDCPLVFPEGHRSRDGALHPFMPGIGLMAVAMQVPVVPVHIDGLFALFGPGRRWPRRGPVRLRVGEALRFAPGTAHREAAQRIEAAVRTLAGSAQRRGDFTPA
jgi:long-chain acyl-CoA synthetase